MKLSQATGFKAQHVSGLPKFLRLVINPAPFLPTYVPTVFHYSKLEHSTAHYPPLFNSIPIIPDTANMVHLTTIPNDKAANAPLVKGMENLKLEPNDEQDEVTASVYGSRFAAECLPMHEMPEKEMPKEIAYRMIKDDLSLDGNPMLNLASFVTTYMVCLTSWCGLHSALTGKYYV